MFPALLLVLLTLAPAISLAAEGVTQPMLQTVAERSGFQATSTSAQVAQFVQRSARAEHIHAYPFGKTVEGRPLLVAVAANPPVRNPDDLRDDPRAVVILLGNIHSGECAGKEALLMLLRDLALHPEHEWFRELVILIAPNYNADGNERRGAGHRPGQLGPQVMGRRENAQGLDLNRDFVKLDSPEARSLVALLNAWEPEMLVDMHTTNGSQHRYDLTYAIAENPAASASIREYLRESMMPAVRARLKSADFNTFYYGNFNREHTRWSTFDDKPRYSTEYYGLRGGIGILAEAYSYIPYQRRIEVSRAFAAGCLEYLAGHRQQVQQLIGQADRQLVAAGRRPAVGDRVAIRSRLAPFDDKAVIEGFVGGRAGNAPKDYEVEFWGRFEPEHHVQRPFAYLIPFRQSRVADRLRMHGIRLERLERDTTVEVEIYRAAKLDRAASSFQAHELVQAEVESRRESRRVPAGTYVVSVSQRLGNLAIYLLEPESDDGLVTWNFFDDSWNRGGDFPVLRVPTPVALRTAEVDRIEPAQQLTLDNIFGERPLPFSTSSSASWIADSEKYAMRLGRRTLHVNAADGAAEPDPSSRRIGPAFAALPGVSARDAEEIARRTHTLSPDGRARLVNFSNDLFYYEVESARVVRLTNGQEPEQLPRFSPDGKLVAYVRGNDLWVVEVESGVERRLTSDGSEQLLNGILDWVYQEELYGRGNFQAYWWSPDSSRIAFLQLDEEPVLRYTVADTIPYRQSLEVTPYPKAGDPLPRVRLGTVRATGGAPVWVDHYEYGPAELLISRVDWHADGAQVVYQIQDRPQTWLDLRAADPDTGRSRRLLRETTPAWVSVLGPPEWLADGSFLWLSERSGNQHIYHVAADGKSEQAVTSGPWDVTSLDGADEQAGWVYFTARKDSPRDAQGYRCRLDGSGTQRLTRGAGTHRLQFSKNRQWFIDTHSALQTPPQTRLCKADGTLVRVLVPNLDDHLRYFRLGAIESYQVPAGDGALMEALLIKPPDFDPSRKYPVLVYAYSGPQAPVVRNRWGGSTLLWHQLLAQHGYCVWMCDNTLASAKGARLAWPSHRKLGQGELRDIETGIDWLQQRFSWVDEDRIGIWGWSYGGYITSYALTHSQRFKAGISGAPVTDWRNYDAIYTERYMGLPQDNPAGYEQASVVKAAAQLHGQLLLIHGTQDDNVHMGNTLQLAYALQQAGKQFQLMFYPKNRHGIRRPDQVLHMRTMMTNFLLDNL